MIAQLSFPECHRRGGVERILVECANFLATRGHDISVLSGTFDAGVLLPGVHQERIAVSGRFALSRLTSYRRRASERLDGLRRAAAPAPSVHAAFGVVCPVDSVLWVQSVHAQWLRLARASRSFGGRLKQRLNPFHPYILRLERDYYRNRRYRRLIALTPRVRAELIEHYDVPAADIALLPNGYNPDEFNPARRAAQRDLVRGEFGYAADDRVLVFVANELERKGFFPLVEALASVKEPQIKLLVVGRVSLEPHKPLLARLGIESQVRCVGPSADVARYYAAADLFVLPTYYEAWGLVIVEALACGLPVLTSRLAGASAAVQEEFTGLLLDNPRDPQEIAGKLLQLLHSDPPLAPAPESIAKSVQAYQWPKLLLGYEAILAENCR